ncbi:rhodanese-like domain-containing protein 6 isoform X2 [Phragmites australis]|uniref:rhodanese-like domain-containing protein 6 isoform X2 n=1 Tax=Phragmites australis TaxID=29695 RepID=UPI002D775D68|nr:rhodanese-like domain-containing protein 6 isoform X2 [Phragmites australis]
MDATPPQQQQRRGGVGDGDRCGVLLYYKYAEVPDAASLAAFYEAHCRGLALVGRVRVGPDGVNATLGGRMTALEKHIAEMSSKTLFEGTDFKLASCEDPVDERVARECGFTSLSVRVVKELVTLCSNPTVAPPEISSAGRHLSAAEFNSILQSVAGNSLDAEAPAEKNEVVVLDARNVYETRIGKFNVPNVETLDPEIRQYSDLPSWIDGHTEKLRGKSILMYCTGGIRCEMASAYIRSKGEGFENVFQLYGGIQRYLEQFPDGGYFDGKNFVFDHRISVGSLKENILGTCLICGSSYDDYSACCRCSHCRMLVLVCPTCQDSTKKYVCELCQKNGEESCRISPTQDCEIQLGLSESSDFEKTSISNDFATSKFPRSNGSEQLKRLRILCLHGFRQNASNFKGRTSALAKKLKHIAELVFIDAPHELSFVYHPIQGHCSDKPSPPSVTAKQKFAWLISPNSSCNAEQDWKVADAPFDPLQYQQQTKGFEESYAYLENAISQVRSFDGILGFSQGAAMAALFCKQQQKTTGSLKFRFGIFCSGYPAPVGDFDSEWIKLPSLHCFGNAEGHDRQIANRASIELAGLFAQDCCSIVEHDMGHIIPTRPPYIDQIKDFLCKFQ